MFFRGGGTRNLNVKKEKNMSSDVLSWRRYEKFKYEEREKHVGALKW
jgi:hypothetical protein